MFELPEAKRVRRNEVSVLSPSSSTTSSPEIVPVHDEDAHARLGALLAFDLSTPDTSGSALKTGDTSQTPKEATNNGDKLDNHDEEEEEEEFEFRLFSAPSKKITNSATDSSKQDTQEKDDTIKTQKLKIRLRSPTPVEVQAGDGRFVVPFRGWRYYFTKPELMHLSVRNEQERDQLEEEESNKRKQYEEVSVTGAEVLDWAQTEIPGCHLPWRVIHLNSKGQKVSKSVLRNTATTDTKTQTTTNPESKPTKSKPGKKRRIILRTRAAAAAAAAEAAAATSNMTEAEKRNKKNREKKIRKRQREREKKAALAAGDVAAETVSVDGDLSD